MAGGVLPDAGAHRLGTVLIYPPVTLYCGKAAATDPGIDLSRLPRSARAPM